MAAIFDQIDGEEAVSARRRYLLPPVPCEGHSMSEAHAGTGFTSEVIGFNEHPSVRGVFPKGGRRVFMRLLRGGPPAGRTPLSNPWDCSSGGSSPVPISCHAGPSGYGTRQRRCKVPGLA